MKSCHDLDDYLDNKLSPEERRRFEAHISSCSPCREEAAVWNRLVSEIQDIGREQIDAQPMVASSASHAFEDMDRTWNSNRNKSNIVKWAAAAAVLVALAVALFVGTSAKDEGTFGAATSVSFRALYFADETAPEERILTTDAPIQATKGQRILIDLGNDRVGIKTGSTVSIETSDQESRILHLESGTLACSVEPKPHDHPFMVHAGYHRVVVVGTKFSVTLGGNDRVNVAVKEGTVDVTNTHSGETRRVTGGENLRTLANAEYAVSNSHPKEISEIETLLNPRPTEARGQDTDEKTRESDSGSNKPSTRKQESKATSPVKSITQTHRSEKNRDEENPIQKWQTWVLDGRIDDAENELEKYVRKMPGSAEAWFLLADCSKRKKSYSEAVSIYKRSIPKISERAAATARYRAAVVLQDNLGAHRKATPLLEQFLKSTDRTHHLRAEAMLRLGLSLRATGQNEQANALFRQIVEHHGATAAAVRAKKLMKQ